MGFQLKDFAQLQKSFGESVSVLKEHHKVSTLDELPSERQGQVKFIQAISDKLAQTDKNVSRQKDSHILTGAMLVVRYLIADSYSLCSPKNSKYYQLLAEAIGLNDENILEDEDVLRLVKEFRGFLIHQLFINGDSRNGMKENNIFAGIEGYGFKAGRSIEAMQAVTIKINELIHTHEDIIFERTMNEVTARHLAERAASKTGHRFGSIFRSNSSEQAQESDSNGVEAGASAASNPA